MIYNTTGKSRPFEIVWGWEYTLQYGFPAIYVRNGKPASIIRLELVK